MYTHIHVSICMHGAILITLPPIYLKLQTRYATFYNCYRVREGEREREREVERGRWRGEVEREREG